jgi:Arc/MetJ-type ribon-helix-helix transcriptional regulator
VTDRERESINSVHWEYMGTTKVYAVTMPPEMARQAERLAKKENRTMSELIREALRQYQRQQKRAVNSDLLAAVRAVQEDAKRSGLNKLTKREINAEISAYRRERVNHPWKSWSSITKF